MKTELLRTILRLFRRQPPPLLLLPAPKQAVGTVKTHDQANRWGSTSPDDVINENL